MTGSEDITLTVTKTRVLEAAESSCPDIKDTLRILFPEAFEPPKAAGRPFKVGDIVTHSKHGLAVIRWLDPHNALLEILAPDFSEGHHGDTNNAVIPSGHGWYSSFEFITLKYSVD